MAERLVAERASKTYPEPRLGGALVAETELLLCDEPLSNLDADLRERMRVEISSLVRGALANRHHGPNPSP